MKSASDISSKKAKYQRAITTSFSLRSKATSENKSEKSTFKYPFLLNRSGIPLNEETWERLWAHAVSMYPHAKNEITAIKDMDNCDEVPVPHPPNITNSPVLTAVRQLQTYIQHLTYNHTGTQLFNIGKCRPFSSLMEIARNIIKEALPIKCLEAVVLALYLTSELTAVNRFPIGFKSKRNGKYHYHIVLGVAHRSMYGSMGISRRKDLMDKPLNFKSLTSLLENFQLSYAKNGHELLKVRLGKFVTHNIHSMERIQWRCTSINYHKLTSDERYKKIETFSKVMKRDCQHSTSYSILPPIVLNKSTTVLPSIKPGVKRKHQNQVKKKKKTVRKARPRIPKIKC